MTPMRYDVTGINNIGNARIAGVVDTGECSQIPNFFDTRPILHRTWLIPSLVDTKPYSIMNLFDIERIRYQTHLLRNLYDSKIIWYQAYLNSKLIL